jgi:hypothetical protein
MAFSNHLPSQQSPGSNVRLGPKADSCTAAKMNEYVASKGKPKMALPTIGAA